MIEKYKCKEKRLDVLCYMFNIHLLFFSFSFISIDPFIKWTDYFYWLDQISEVTTFPHLLYFILYWVIFVFQIFNKLENNFNGNIFKTSTNMLFFIHHSIYKDLYDIHKCYLLTEISYLSMYLISLTKWNFCTSACSIY